MTLRELIVAHRDWQHETVIKADEILSTFDPDNSTELKAAWFARRIHAENSRDRLTLILETAE